MSFLDKRLEPIHPKEAILNDWARQRVGLLYKVPADYRCGVWVDRSLADSTEFKTVVADCPIALTRGL
jgi:hypothetical protein